MKPMLMAATLTLVGGTAWAELPVLAADVGVTANVISTRQFDLVSSTDHLALGHVGAAITFEIPYSALDVELAYHGGEVAEQAHSTVKASLAMKGVEVGATWRYPWLRHLHPYAHLGVGVDWATLTLFDTSRLTQTVANPSGTGLVGVQVPFRLARKPAGRAPVLLIDVGVGYTLRPGYAFTTLAPTPGTPQPADPVPSSTVNVGTMPLSGITYRVLLALRY